MTAALQRLGAIRLFRLKVRASFAPSIAMESEPLALAVETLGRLGEADEVDLVLSPKRYSRAGMLSGGLSRIAQGLARHPDLHDAASVFKVGGLRTDTGEPAEVDILRDQMVAAEQIVRHSKRGRSLNERSAYEAIIRAYTGFEGELSRAASARIMP